VDRMLRATFGRGILLIRGRLPGFQAFAEAEQLSPSEAAVRLLKLAHFHRASEILYGKKIFPTPIVDEVLRRARIDEEFCLRLARDGPRLGSGWAGFTYSRLLSPIERRFRGQFFTPGRIADFMTVWAIRSCNDFVFDPGTGPGIFLRSAYKRLTRLGSRDPVSQLTGIELSPVAPAFASLALEPASSKRPKVIFGDFLTHQLSLHRYDAVVGNPPYSRHHSLAPEYKRRIGADADALLGEHLSMRAGLYVHFLIRSLTLLRDGGRLAFLTPLEFFNAHYGAPLRRHLSKTTKLRALIVFDPENGSAFEDATTTSAIILAERGAPDGKPVRIVHIKGTVSNQELIYALRAKTTEVPSQWGTSLDVSAGHLMKVGRWSDFLLPGRSKRDEKEVALSVLADVKRGIATGANKFFVLSDKAARAARLTREYLRPVIARARIADALLITQRDFDRWKRTGERVWLLDIRTTLTRAVKRYLESGKRAGFHKRYLCRNRKVWYKMERRAIPPIIVTYMSRGRLRFISNGAGVVPLNVFHAIYPTNLMPYQLKRLLSYLNSKTCHKKLRRLGRTYGSGLLKIEPGELLSLRVPDVRRRR
jgi:hypothetical protein